jgi:hypothetical protein
VWGCQHESLFESFWIVEQAATHARATRRHSPTVHAALALEMSTSRLERFTASRSRCTSSVPAPAAIF